MRPQFLLQTILGEGRSQENERFEGVFSFKSLDFGFFEIEK